MQQAFLNNPERFVKGVPVINLPPKEVWINKPDVKKQPETVSLNTFNQLSHFYWQVPLKIYNPVGQELQEIDYTIHALINHINWDIATGTSKQSYEGIYFVKAQRDDFKSIRKFVIVK